MTKEVMKLKSDLRHTTTARARAERREEKARDGLKVAKVELREVRDGLQAARMIWWWPGTGWRPPRLSFR